MRALHTPTFALDRGLTWSAQAALGPLAVLLRDERVAIVHAHCFHPTLLGLLAARLAGVRFVFTRHHSDHHIRIGKRWHTRVDAACARRADRVIAVSHATRAILTDVERVPAERIRVVWNGMEPLAPPSAASLEALRAALGLDGRPVCVVPARLHEEKGLFVLLAALADVVRDVPDVLVLCAGEGPHRPALEHEAAARGLDRNVRFLGQRRDVPALVAASSLVLLPSLAESFGFAALEAMSLGRAVVTSRAGGLPEVVGDAGLLADVGDAAGLARAITRLLRDPAQAEALGRRGRERAATFTCERMVRGYEAVYAELD
jgi:glycosyltransferase involved in cell wall biosynthesis